MECPQCGAEVPSDDAFCGKCGYARRDQTPDRLDQSRIRVHESPAPSPDDEPSRPSSQRRVRKQTVLGIQPGTPPAGVPTPAPIPSPPPTPISSARQERSPSRTPQKTMIGMRPLEPMAPAPEAPQPGETVANPDPRSDGTQGDPAGPAAPSHRVRARVRYDSANEPLPVIRKRARALRGLAVLVVLAAAWLGYRYLTLHG
ncbi:MAG: zinc-ribbon domain-containing protein [Deltaproteobacteria bacterium]|nr:zinc-ribbon domain-containing protein [Deltaproteobacteria bacterium]NND28424.1 zinc-ribbon domain-containing protein [Myxococcales bacterium]MBT8464167.1 zinc-ribbon domain-containing protein [Deltaproteobacteria bacterium]MBT8483403.1 zinc-ribbon domain-containing protein [Deltaproteobacteria bacterium]NNK08755.1 zinc-ribbon domain-containing protein [Myxococcales bacterium]